LFKELEARNRDLTTALDQRTATAEILRVISSSPTNVQPTFEAIAESATRLCGAVNGLVFRFDGELIHAVAHHNIGGAELDAILSVFPIRPGRGSVAGRAIESLRIVHVEDLAQDPEYEQTRVVQAGFRTALSVPMLRGGVPIGTINVMRMAVAPFSPSQIALLQTFADQAVIAIENVRLFKELEASNRELTTALDTQTATSDILRVISRSQTDVQPVFDAILRSAVRLLGGHSGTLTRVEGDQIVLAAMTSTDDAGNAILKTAFPQSLHAEGPHPRAIRDRAPFNVSDAYTDPRLREIAHANARVRGYRSQIVIPMIRQDWGIGTISVTRQAAGGFAVEEIALLQTFADQAVIAIENARLLTELQERTQELTRSVDQLTALGEIGRAVSSTLDLETVLSTIVARASELAGTNACTVYEYDDTTGEFHWRASANPDEAVEAVARRTTIPRGVGAQGRMAMTRAPVQIPDIAAEGAYHGPLRDVLLQTGTRAILAVPLLRDDQLVGGLTVNRKTPGEFTPEVVELLKTFAAQSALAIQNARLFREIADKSRQLEVASQHKSEFLANMSHELRTPLNAIIGFSEVLTDRMFGELNEKQEEYLKDIHASGTHLLSLINDILDLSKIEAGRMELELTDFHLPTALDSALTLIRERAGRRNVALHTNIDNRLGEIRADERKIRQVVLNLLSNAIKFTPEGGRIDVAAAPRVGSVEISVSDTGVGIAPEDQEAVFEEFRQVGTAEKKAEGTGLGLALCRRFVELHGGKVRVQSEVGRGSTFTFTIPVHRGE
jgi:signal transduction histidine kinase